MASTNFENQAKLSECFGVCVCVCEVLLKFCITLYTRTLEFYSCVYV